MLDREEEISEEESDGLLRQTGETFREKSRKRRISRGLFVFSVSLNGFLIALGLIFWSRQIFVVQHSYERGFTSDLGK
jgi:hypothetical protein